MVILTFFTSYIIVNMLVRVLLVLIALGLLWLVLGPKPHHKKVMLPHDQLQQHTGIAGVYDDGQLYNAGKLGPPPGNKLPISHTGQANLPPDVPSTEMQLLLQPSPPALRVGA